MKNIGIRSKNSYQ